MFWNHENYKGKTLKRKFKLMYDLMGYRYITKKKRAILTILLMTLISFQIPSSQGIEDEDTALWQSEMTIKDYPIDYSWWLKGHDLGNITNDWVPAADKVVNLMKWNKTLADNFVMVFGNSHNSTLFIVLTKLDDSIINPIEKLLETEDINIRFLKGVSSINKLNDWIKRLNISELQKAGIQISSCSISVNGTIIITMKEVSVENLDKLSSFIQDKIPPGVIVVGKAEDTELVDTQIRPLVGGIGIQTGIYIGNNNWNTSYSTLGFIVTAGTQKYAVIAGHAIHDPGLPLGGNVYQPTLFNTSDLIGSVENYYVSAGRYSDSAVVPLEDGVEGESAVRLPLNTVDIQSERTYDQQYIGMGVQKMGITTGYTTGQIIDKPLIELHDLYGYLVHQIRANCTAQPGDSGGPIWTTINGVNYAVGITSKRIYVNNYTVYSPIDGVERDQGLRFFERVSLVVRGTTPDIWTSDMLLPDSWLAYNNIPGGTSDSPAATVYEDKLYIVVRTTDGNSLNFGSINRATGVFSGWTYISGSTSSSPTFTSGNGKLALVVRGQDNQIWYRIYTISNNTWNSWSTLPSGSTSQSPGATILNNILHVVVTANGGTALYHSTLNLSTYVFSGWTQIEGASQSSPTLASFDSLWVEDRVCLVVRGVSNDIFLKEWSQSTGWSQDWRYLYGSTVYSVGATVLKNSLHVVCIGTDSNLRWSSLSLLSYSFSGWTQIGGSTPFRPTLASEAGVE